MYRQALGQQINMEKDNFFFFFFFVGKLHITFPKFESDWILHLQVSEFGFYPHEVWILHLDVSEFGFYTLKF